MPNIAIAVLAAGASVRMGQPKQLLEYKGKTLLQHAIDTALGTSCRPVLVVVGSLEHLPGIDRPNCEYRVLHNAESEQGIASSICVAASEAQAEKEIDALLFLNCDQPLIDSSSLERLLAKYESGAIVASRFEQTVGSPAVFDRCFFGELLALRGDRGARSIIERHRAIVSEVALAEASFDVDTPTDYQSVVEDR
jgi:molybdenum cofactor cytidylyltransferase